MQEKLVARDSVVRSVVEESFSMPETSLSNLVENFRPSPNQSVS